MPVKIAKRWVPMVFRQKVSPPIPEEDKIRPIVAGTVIKRSISSPETVKVRVLKMHLDRYIKKYYFRRHDFWVLEKDVKGRVGDLVLIKRLDKPYSVRVNHEIFKYVHKLGEMICPVTGRGIRGREYVDPERKDHIANSPEGWKDTVMKDSPMINKFYDEKNKKPEDITIPVEFKGKLRKARVRKISDGETEIL